MLSFFKKDKIFNYIFSQYQSNQVNGLRFDAEIAKCNMNQTVNTSNSVDIDMPIDSSNSTKSCL